MFKLILMLLGAATGAAGTASWLLSEPETSPSLSPIAGSTLRGRWQELNLRLKDAAAEGQRAGAETESRLRRDLDIYRAGKRPSGS